MKFLVLFCIFMSFELIANDHHLGLDKSYLSLGSEVVKPAKVYDKPGKDLVVKTAEIEQCTVVDDSVPFCNCSKKRCEGKAPLKERALILGKSKLKPVPRKKINGHNRYYFIRSCDSPESLSRFIFGNESYASLFVSQLGGRESFVPGKMVTFKSPLKPNDKMRSFFADHPGLTEKYIVKRGDTMQKISYEKTGDIRNWREISSMNGISSPDLLFIGQKLTVKYKE